MQEHYYVVRVDDEDVGDLSADAVYGDGPIVFADRADAERKAAELGTSGEWGDDGPPTYSVEECDYDDLTPYERAQVDAACTDD